MRGDRLLADRQAVAGSFPCWLLQAWAHSRSVAAVDRLEGEAIGRQWLQAAFPAFGLGRQHRSWGRDGLALASLGVPLASLGIPPE